MTEQTEMDVRPVDLATARAIGERGAQLATDKAEREQPGFAARAEAAVLAKLAIGPASAEDLTDHVRACGIEFKDGRALGNVYKSLRDRGLIEIVGECQRRYGNGTSGGHLWARCAQAEAHA